jgi:hypothetical protein
MPTRRKKKFEVNYTVGRIEDGNAILLSSDHLIDVPLSLLPNEVDINEFTLETNLTNVKNVANDSHRVATLNNTHKFMPTM